MPWLSVTVEYVPPIKLGLEMATVTPGRTAPELSVIVPVSVEVVCACAWSGRGRATTARTRKRTVTQADIRSRTSRLLFSISTCVLS